MRLSDALKLALQNLLRTKFRSFLTSLGVIIGISAIVLFVSLGIGLQKITSDQIATIDVLTTLTVSQKPETSSMAAGPGLSEKSVELFKKIGNVSRVSETVSMPANIWYKETSAGAIVNGTKQENANIELSGLKYGKVMQNNDEIVITSALANAFDSKQDNVIGRDIIIKIIRNVDGVDYKTEELPFKVSGIDSNDTTNIVYAPFDKIYKAGQFDKFSSVKIKVNSRKDIDGVKSEVEKLGYQVTTIKDLIDQIDQVFLLIEMILALVGGIGLLVSSLGIINTMTISLLERTHEIGIMKAIGASNKDLGRLFFLESALIGFFGGVTGVAIAVLLGDLFNFCINLLIKESGRQFDFFVIPIKFSFYVVLFSILVAVTAGVYPAYRAKRLSPMDALRQVN